MPGKFRILEDEATADLAFEAYGKNLEKMYENSALALFSIMTDLEDVEVRERDLIVVEAEDREALLLDFLNELIYRREVDRVLFSDFKCDIEETGEGLKISADCSGEKFDRSEHEAKVEVKAVTYFGMEIEEEGGSWRAKVTLDL